MTTLLVEIGCEELPAAVCRSIYSQLVGTADSAQGGLVYKLLRDERLLAPAKGDQGSPVSDESDSAARLQVLISPRRIAVLVRDIPARQNAQTQVFRGPRVAAAYGPDGALTKAGLGFARSRGVVSEDLTREVVDGTEFIVARVASEQRPTREVLPALIARLVGAIQISRGMRWGARPVGEADYLRFSRPIRWLVCKLGKETIEFPFYGLTAGDVSQGHRMLGESVTIDDADNYVALLREQMVVVDQDERRQQIEADLDACAASPNGVWSDPGDVLEEVMYLVEWPTAHKGAFAESHLRFPDDVLITAMQSHQRYFPVRDSAGKLLPVFLYVNNAGPKSVEIITGGNERVLNGRLEDAEFAYDRDVHEGLKVLAAKLPAVSFHENLGSLADKTERLKLLVSWLVTHGGTGSGDLEKKVVTAASYAKADLPSQVVQEFPTLQGKMGGHYAAAAGLGDEVAQAIVEQYMPLSATAPVPGSLTGAILAIADKADNIAAAWVTGEKPSGSRDPYGLRRAAMGIVRIALEFSLRFSVEKLMSRALLAYAEQDAPSPADGAAAEMADFVWERLQALLLDEGLPFELVEAAMGSVAVAGAPGLDIPARAARARSFAALEGRASFNDVVAAFNRCAPLAAKAVAPSTVNRPAGSARWNDPTVDPSLFAEPVEAELHAALVAQRDPVLEQLGHLEIDSAIMAAAHLRPVIDRYFEAVLVMSDDAAVRANRLAQLNEITAVLRAIGDFGRLPAQGA